MDVTIACMRTGSSRTIAVTEEETLSGLKEKALAAIRSAESSPEDTPLTRTLSVRSMQLFDSTTLGRTGSRSRLLDDEVPLCRSGLSCGDTLMVDFATSTLQRFSRKEHWKCPAQYRNACTRLSLSPCGRWCVSGSMYAPNGLCLIDLANGEVTRPVTEGRIRALDLTQKHIIYVLESSSVVTVLDRTTFEVLHHLQCGTRVWSMSATPCVDYLAVSVSTGLFVFNTRTGEVVRKVPHTCLHLKVSPNGRFVACVSSELALFRFGTGEKVFERSLEGTCSSVTFSPCSTLIAASVKNTSVVYDTDGNHLLTLSGHTETVWESKFSSCSEYLFTCSADTRVMQWDLVTGESVYQFSCGTRAKTSLAVSPDTRSVVFADFDTLRVESIPGRDGDVDTGDMVEALSCAEESTDVDSIQTIEGHEVLRVPGASRQREAQREAQPTQPAPTTAGSAAAPRPAPIRKTASRRHSHYRRHKDGDCRCC